MEIDELKQITEEHFGMKCISKFGKRYSSFHPFIGIAFENGYRLTFLGKYMQTERRTPYAALKSHKRKVKEDWQYQKNFLNLRAYIKTYEKEEKNS